MKMAKLTGKKIMFAVIIANMIFTAIFCSVSSAKKNAAEEAAKEAAQEIDKLSFELKVIQNENESLKIENYNLRKGIQRRDEKLGNTEEDDAEELAKLLWQFKNYASKEELRQICWCVFNRMTITGRPIKEVLIDCLMVYNTTPSIVEDELLEIAQEELAAYRNGEQKYPLDYWILCINNEGGIQFYHK